MPGAVNQLALYGKEDALLSANPEITFFRLRYKRYSIFSMEAISQSFQSEATFGRRVTLPVTRSGDLVNSIFIEVNLPDLSDFAIDAVTNAQAAVPGIVSARWTSSTTGSVKIIPATDGTDDSYDVYVDDGSSPFTVNGAAGVTSITITGLDTAKSYDISVRRVASATPGSYSATVPLSSLRWCNSIGHALMRTVDFEIGGARISRLSGEFMDVDAEQTMPSEKESGFNEMVGKYSSYDLYDNSFETRKLYIPLTFAFNKFHALSIPLISLIYHQVNLVFDFREYTELIKSTHPISSLVSQQGKTPTPDIDAFCTFVFLGSQERKKFLETPQEILVQDIQFVGDAAVVASSSGDLSKKYELSFIHPVSELIWTYNRASSFNSGITPSTYPTVGNDYFNYDAPAGASIDPIKSAMVYINGNQRYSERSGKYHRLVQPYGHHTRIPAKKIYSYSFAIEPESPNPTGSINLSRADTAHLQVTFDESFALGGSNGRLRIYARTLNIIRFAGGMGTLLFTST